MQSDARPKPISPSHAALAAAAQVGRLLHKDLSHRPDQVDIRIDYDTDSTTWRMRWIDPRVEVRFNPTYATLTNVMCNDSLEGIMESIQQGRPIVIAQSQAVAIVERFSRGVRAAQGDWRVTEAIPPETKPDTTRPYWFVRLTRFVGRYPVLGPGIGATVNPYDGSLSYWSASYADCIPNQSATLMTEGQARQIAAAALREAGLVDTIAPPPWLGGRFLGWVKLAPKSPLHRLGYRFLYKAPVPNIYGEDGIEILIDGESGQIWRFGSVFSGNIQGRPNGPIGAWTTLVVALLNTPEAALCGRAVAGGLPLAESELQTDGRTVTRAVYGTYWDFQLATDTRVLA